MSEIRDNLRVAIHNLIFHSKAKDATELLDQILNIDIIKQAIEGAEDEEHQKARDK